MVKVNEKVINHDKGKRKMTDKMIIETRRKKRDAERKRRERIKNNSEMYEEAKKKERERYYKRIKEGKLKTVTQMTKRNQRKQRKAWRIRSKRCRENKKAKVELATLMRNNSPPSSLENKSNSIDEANEKYNLRSANISDNAESKTTSLSNSQACSSRKESGMKKHLRNYNKAHKKIKELEKKMIHMEKKVAKYKMKYHRLVKDKVNLNSPQTKVKTFLKGEKVSPKIHKKLIYCEALTTQLTKNFHSLKERNAKKQFSRAVGGKIFKKYKCLLTSQTFLTYKLHRANKDKQFSLKLEKKDYRSKISSTVKADVQKFLEKDENSRMCAGKKDCVTKNKIKKQKRILNNTLQYLHTKFLEKYYSISYSSFCKLRPFWILPPHINGRDTCLCAKHNNMEMIVEQLNNLKIIKQKNPVEVISTLCCRSIAEKCLERKCKHCKTLKIVTEIFDSKKETAYPKWKNTKSDILVKGKIITTQKYVKSIVLCTQGELFKILEDSIPDFMLHVSRINHQYKSIEHLKKELKKEEVLIHIDFSENYSCKYSKEAQSVHFGGSRQQVTLHTGLIYYRCSETKILKLHSFCSLSESLCHNPSAICAHLHPVLDFIREKIPHVQVLHFLSDSPATQYRNKKMFYLLATHIPHYLTVNQITWNFSESGHGKGAPDGIGGALKRTADRIVAQGNDIDNFYKLIKYLKEEKSSVHIMTVSLEDISKVETYLPSNIETFKGTMKIHQVTWSDKYQDNLNFRKLSCFTCKPGEKCQHYQLGVLKITARALSAPTSILFSLIIDLEIFINYISLFKFKLRFKSEFYTKLA